MPAAAQPRVRTPVSSLQEQVEHLHFHEAPARCKSPCCATVISPDSTSVSKRPALNRNAASHQSARSGKSMYSTGTDGSSYLQSDAGSTNLSDYPDVIDMAIFDQILQMDDDEDDREFSTEIVTGFIEQAEQTLTKMNDELDKKDLLSLSNLGHFLKGSSATLGLVKVQKSCEKIQNFGKRLDATGAAPQPDDEKSLQNIRTSVKDVDNEYHEAKQLLTRFFNIDA